METVIDDLEDLIDDIERDSTITKEDILNSLYKMKQKIEDQQLEEDNRTIEWDDLVDLIIFNIYN